LSSSSQKRLIPYAALSASYFAHVGLFLPYLPLWLSDLGLSLLVISWLNAIPPATRLAAPYLWGWLSDHTGRPSRIMRICASACVIGSVGLCWGLDLGIPWLALSLLVLFFHNSALMPMSEAAIAKEVTHAGQFDTRLYGRVRLWGSGGFLITVLGAGAWYQWQGIDSLPWLSLAAIVLLWVIVWRLPQTVEAKHAEQRSAAVGPVLRQREVRWFFGAAFFHVLSHMSVHVFLSLYLASLGYGKAMIGVLWAFSVIVEIGWFSTQGRWLPRWPLTTWLMLSAALMVVRMVLTAGLADWLLVALLAQAMHAITFAAHHTACTALLTRYFPANLRSRGQALYVIFAYGFAGVLGALFGGVLSERYGLASVFWVCALLSLIALGFAAKLSSLNRPKG
jgi:MFS transporter, PPP family, 3-phenylpropionic acid transporter